MDLKEARIFQVDVDGHPPVKVEIECCDLHDFNVADRCGTGIMLTGEGRQHGSNTIAIMVTDVKSVYGNSQPEAQEG